MRIMITNPHRQESLIEQEKANSIECIYIIYTCTCLLCCVAIFCSALTCICYVYRCIMYYGQLESLESVYTKLY